jgi:hypothetical protein
MLGEIEVHEARGLLSIHPDILCMLAATSKEGGTMLAIQKQTAVSAVDGAFRVYRENFKPLFLLSLIVGVPATLSAVVFQILVFRMANTPTESDLGLGGFSPLVGLALLGGAVMSLFIAMIAGMFGMAGATRIASLAALQRPVSLKDGLSAAFDVFWPLLGASFAVSLLAALASLLLVVPGIIVFVGYAFIAPVIVLERTSVDQAMSRSWKLTRGRRWSVFGAIILVAILIGTASGGVAFLGVLTGVLDQSLAGQITQTLIQQVGSVLAYPLYYVTIVLLYYGARVEVEAFDVETLTRLALPESAPQP